MLEYTRFCTITHSIFSSPNEWIRASLSLFISRLHYTTLYTAQYNSTGNGIHRWAKTSVIEWEFFTRYHYLAHDITQQSIEPFSFFERNRASASHLMGLDSARPHSTSLARLLTGLGYRTTVWQLNTAWQWSVLTMCTRKCPNKRGPTGSLPLPSFTSYSLNPVSMST